MHKKIKPIFNNRVHLTFKGSLKNIALILLHIIGIVSYFIVIQLVARFQFGKFNFDFNNQDALLIVLLFIFIIIIPIINGIGHIIYLDTGWISLRMLVWINTWLMILVIPVLIFI